MAGKIRIALLFGGRSAEHEVSVKSARNIYQALDKTKYDISLIGIDMKGTWLPYTAPKLFKDPTVSERMSSQQNILVKQFSSNLQNPSPDVQKPFDVVFPVLHGPYGEDGSVQGLCKLLGIPYVGANVLGSAVGMDKDIMKRLLRDAGIPVGNFLTATKSTLPSFAKITKQFGVPFFIKPANLGSSIGVSKVTTSKDFEKAVTGAFSYDSKILIEAYIEGREVECSVLGNDTPVASLPGEIMLNADFYDYEAKYLDENGAQLKIPADLSKHLISKIQKLAVETFQTLCLSGMARVDFFLTEDKKIYVNEVNTLPGFTDISMYPKLWEASGMPQAVLLDSLINLAIAAHETEMQLKTSLEY